MKRVLSLMLVLMLVFVTSISSAASLENTNGNVQTDTFDGEIPIGLQSTIDDYFSLRNTILSSRAQSIAVTAVEFSAPFSQISSNSTLINTELERASAADNLAKYHGVYLVGSSNSASIQEITPIDEVSYLLDVYEWTWIQYNDGKNGDIDTMGYATNHQMTVCRSADMTYQVLDDIYDESAILGIPAAQDELTDLLSDDSSFAISSTDSGINSNVNLNVNHLIDYADKWVIHAHTTTKQNTANYNLTQYGYYTADCANFTSQCLKAGGMKNDYGSGKNSASTDDSQWWFDTNPSPSVNNYNASPMPWRYVPSFVNYWTGQGYSQVAATDSSVFPGNPVINDNAHVGICVGYNASGIPIINAHNRDAYHVPYTMIGDGSRTTIQITTSNQMHHKPSSATEITPTASTQQQGMYLSAGSNHYFKFTVEDAGYYTFGSAYYASSKLDTKATLYKESEYSNGRTLYLYEIATDDDSGDGSNFNIRANLQPGTYYIRVRAYANTLSGYYAFTYLRG